MTLSLCEQGTKALHNKGLDIMATAITKPTTSKYADIEVNLAITSSSNGGGMKDTSGFAVIKDRNALKHFLAANANKSGMTRNKACDVVKYLLSQDSDKVAWADIANHFYANDYALWRSSRVGVCAHSPKSMVYTYQIDTRTHGREALLDGLSV